MMHHKTVTIIGAALLAACGAAEDGVWSSDSLGTLEQAVLCDGTDDFQNVELYDGTEGVSIEMVDRAEGPVAHTFSNTGACTGTLIARDILLTVGHCNNVVGNEVWFDDQIGPDGFPRDPVIHTVTEVIARKNDVNSFPESGRADYALLRLSGNPALTFGYTRVANEEARTVANSNQTLAAIGFPARAGGGNPNPKVVSAGPYGNASTPLLPNWFGAMMDLIPGSSGSGILRRDGQMVGLFTTEGACSGGVGNNAMRMPVLFRQIPMLRQISSMQGVSFANVNGAGGVDAVVVNFNRISARTSNGSSFSNQSSWTTNAFFGFDGTFFANVTNDQRADAISVNNGIIVVRRSQSNNTFGPNETWLNPGIGDFTPIVFADVTGDSIADAVSLSSVTTHVRPSTGNSFGAAQLWAGHTGSLATLVGNVGGSQANDIVAIDDDRVRVRLSTFTNFGPVQNWTSSAFFGAYGTFLADVTGDGRADLIAVNNTATTVRRSTGTGFGANETWLSVQQFGSLGVTFADADGDGDADFIAVNPEGVTVRRSSGMAFGAAETWVNVPYYGAG